MDPTAEGRDRDEMKIPDTKLRLVKVTPGPGAGTGGGDDEAAAERAGAAPSTEAVIAALNTSLLPLRWGHSAEAASMLTLAARPCTGELAATRPSDPAWWASLPASSER